MRLIAVIVFSILLFCNCNEPNRQTSAVSKDTNTILKPNDTSYVNSSNDDTDDNQELKQIIEDFKSQCNRNYNVDTTFKRGIDTFRFVFNYKCLYESGLLIPEKYVGIYGFKSFKAHNFAANLVLYKNNSKIVDDRITKSKFTNQIDSSLKQYGDLLYPYVEIEDTIIKVHFSITIPLTDVGIGTSYITQINGQTYTKRD
jgi:hypothetical protein